MLLKIYSITAAQTKAASRLGQKPLTESVSLRPPLVLVKVPERFGGPQCRNGDISLTSNPGAPPPGALIGKFGTERHMPVPATSLVLLRQKEELILVVCPSKASTRFDDVRDALVS